MSSKFMREILISSGKLDKEKNYWMDKLIHPIEKNNFPFDSISFKLDECKERLISVVLPENVSSKLNTISNKSNQNLLVILLSSLTCMIHKYTGNYDITIGCPINKQQSESDFINTILPIRNKISDDMTFKELIIEVKKSVIDGNANQNYPIEILLDELGVNVNDNSSTIIQTMLLLDSIHDKKYVEHIKRNITFYFTNNCHGIKIDIYYNGYLYSSNTIERIVMHYFKLLDVVLNDINIKLKAINIISELEEKQMLREFNNTTVEFPRESTIHRLFEDQVMKTPENIAAVYKEKQITYRELNEKANQLARLLTNKGVGPETIVGIMVEPSMEMVIGILGILKAGGAYLPIDKEYPRDRIEYMLQDSEAKLLLTKKDVKGEISYSEDIIFLEDNELYEGACENLEAACAPNNLAYVIYTSGSTGKPKGVMIEHKALINMSKWYEKYYEVCEEDRTTKYAGFGFDASVWEIFPYLITGASIYLIEDELKLDILKLNEYYRANKITISFLPTQICEQFMQLENEYLRCVLTGGDKLKQYKNTSYKVVNNYGPTENTIVTTSFIVDKEYNNIPIGKPIFNTKVYIADKYYNLQTIGVPGELCISGDSLARGYLNRKELTAEKFVDNPFEPGTKMYKTGDLARWLPDGNIEFLGRIDHQVKIRGFRIELGEIETTLLSHPEIKEAVVIAKENNNDKYLCAYIICGIELKAAELREYLLKELPSYMVPSYFIQIEKIPLTPNGKVDIKGLPEQEESLEARAEYEGPRNEIEERIIKIWQEILGVETIGINDDFFELGGHSLKATNMIAKLYKELNVEVPLKELFKTATIKGLSAYIDGLDESIYASIQPVEEKEYYELSSAQKRIYTLQQFDLKSTSYNMPMIFDLEGELNVSRLSESFRKIIDRHESLRTSFEISEERAMQKIHKTVELEIEQYEVKSEKELEEIAKGFVKAFDLSKAPLIRVGLVKIHQRRHILMYDMHHIISDGTSMGIIVEEFSRLYAGEELDPLRIQYKDFSEWQNNLFASEKIKKQEGYWLNRFSGEIPVLNLPIDDERPAIQSFEGTTKSFQVEEELTEGLRKIAKATGSTMYMVLMASYNVLLSKYSGQEDIVIGSPIAGRAYADLQNIIGMFVNTLAMRNYPEGKKTFREFLLEVKENALEAYENQEYQFEELVGKLNLARDFSRNPLFDVMFAMQNIDLRKGTVDGVTINPYKSENKISKFDITLNAAETSKNIVFSIEYCTKLFKEETIERLWMHLHQVMKNVVNNLDIKLSEIDIVTEGEKLKLMSQFNNTASEYPMDKTIQEIFEAQVVKTPENTAAVYKDKQMTYRELNEKANQLARVLKNKGVGPETIVGIMVEPSMEMVIGILGILKAGGAYLPIDKEYPRDRIEYMLQDSEGKILLTKKDIKGEISYSGDIIFLEDNELYEGECENLVAACTPNNLAYVIYTSGSTGKPKGVMIEHKSLINMSKWYEKYYEVGEEDRTTKYAGFGFDASVWEIFPYLITGASIYLIEEELKLDIIKLNEYYKANKITISFLPTQICEQFMQLENEYLRCVLTGGDKLKQYKNTSYKVVNNYGPTENTIVTTSFIVDKEYNNIPIGKPISNTKVYIVDNYNNLQTIGVPGELSISGDSLARGYLNRKELTAEKFVDNPFEPNTKMYKTGDLARWLPDGNIEFLGRIDYQVKIRGFRIELGEIENKLLSHPEIKEAVVVDKEDNNDKYLCAYIVADKEQGITGLKEYLLKELPNYMVPSYFIQLEKLPLTQNGKVDRKGLPEPKGCLITKAEYEGPRNEIEGKITGIWQEILGVEKIGINDNFFELGGHSLKATNMIAKLHKELNVEVPLKELFKAPTIKGLSSYIDELEESIYAAIGLVEEREYYELSSAQKRMYALQQFEENNIGYNMPFVMLLEGEVDKPRLEDTFKKLIKRHETLRTSFEIRDGEQVQIIQEEVCFKIDYFSVDKNKAKETIETYIKAFNLSKAPLFRVALINIGSCENILVLDMHHIISDGVSMGIVVKEFKQIYDGMELPSLRIQYKDFSAWQNAMFKSENLQKQEEYWLTTFGDEIQMLNIPTDYQRPVIQSFEGDGITFVLNEEITKKLKNIARETGTTMYMVLLAAYNVLLSKYSGQEDIIVGSPIAGRPHADLENIIGMFVNTLALRNYPEGNKSFRAFLEEVKMNSLKAYENQDYQFEELVNKLNISRDLSRNPLFDVMFSMQNTDIGEIQIEGIKLKPYEVERIKAAFDITLTAIESEDIIVFDLNYCTKLFKKETIENMAKHFINLLSNLSWDIEQTISDIGMLSEDEKHKILVEFNNTEAVYPSDKTLNQLFEEQVEITPNNIALIYEDEQITYKELNTKANNLARVLQDKGVEPDSIVGIMADRSLDMIIGVMAILKAGAAYLPIDPEYPRDRIEYMLTDSNVKILLTQAHISENVNFNGDKIIIKNSLGNIDTNKITRNNKANDLAYIIYTSGSTGKPKGVMIEHKSVVNLIFSVKNQFKVDEKDRILLFSTICFDASVEQIFTALLSGAALVLINKNTLLDEQDFDKYIIKHGITYIDGVPAFLKNVKYKREYKLKRVIVGGDICPVELAKYWSNYCEFYNAYGPTEATVTSTRLLTNNIKGEVNNLSIGKPIDNTQVYILDKNRNIQPIGIPGELYIAGAGLARGYLNREELTSEKFVSNPFNLEQKMYRTGDLVKWLPDGNIEFLGRIDHQVKVRGFRIELGEIESKLLEHESVKEVVVIAKEDRNGSNYLCAYLSIEGELSNRELREYLASELPEYMVPAYFIKLDKLPLNQSGKIDRRALPEPDGNMDTGVEYEAPRNEVEEKIAVIWQEILAVEKIGINNNFFELGGHSLKATSMIAKLHKELNVEVPLKELFRRPTIKGISHYIINNQGVASMPKVEGMILIKKGSERAKDIFVIHDGSGDIGGYLEFCDNIEGDFNFWGIKANKPTEYHPQDMSIEKMASNYVEKILNVQKEGEYNIIGWSLGGVIAFEMARQMEEAKKEIGKLILIDAPAPKLNLKSKILKGFNGNSFTLESEKKVAKLFNYDVKIKEKINSATSIEELWLVVIEYFEKNNLSLDEIKQSEIRNIAGFIPEYNEIGIRDLVYYMNFIRTLNTTIEGYMPKNQINTQVHMFNASGKGVGNKKDWNKLLVHESVCFSIPGDHFTMMQNPNVSKLTAVASEILKK